MSHQKSDHFSETDVLRLKAVLESAPYPVFSLDREYRYTSFNSAHFNVMKALYGVEIELGHRLEEYQSNTDDWKIAQVNLDRALRGEMVRESAQSGSTKETQRYFEVNHFPVRTGNGEVIGVSVFATDITGHKNLEKSLRESNEVFSTVFKGAPMMMMISEVETGKFYDVNEQFTKVSGFSNEEAVGKSSWELGWIKKEDRARLSEQLRIHGRVPAQDLQLTRKDGSTLIAVFSVDIVSFKGKQWLLSMGDDITAQKKVLNRLEEFKKFFSLSNDLFCIATRDGYFQQLNANWEKVLGYTQQELMSRPFVDFVHPDDRSSTQQAVKTQIDGNSVLSFANRYRHKDGSYRWLEWNTTSVLGNQLVYATARDFTERKNAERVQKETQAQLMHSAKLAAIGTLAAGVAHEINNPLMIVKGNIAIIKDRFVRDKKSELCRFLDKQDQAIDRVAGIIKSLGLFARRDNVGTESVNLHQVIQDVIDLCESIYLKDQVTIKTKLKSTHPLASGNMGKLQQVILNLLSNAKDACAGAARGGKILIETSDRDGFLVLKVSDNGIGIKQEHLQQLFNPFFTTKPPGQGTGIGLSISHSIIQSFGGTIGVETKLGAGTTFTIQLPTASPALPKTKGTQHRHGNRLSGSALIVDDEKEIREILCHFLSDLGLKVTTAPDGVAALEILKDHKFDYVITDIKMPGMSGDLLLKKMSELPHLAKTRSVVVTGCIVSDYTVEELENIRAYSQGIVRKPFDQDSIALALEMAASGKSVFHND